MAEMRGYIIKDHEQAKNDLRKFAHEIHTSASKTTNGLSEKKFKVGDGDGDFGGQSRDTNQLIETMENKIGEYHGVKDHSSSRKLCTRKVAGKFACRRLNFNQYQMKRIP